jgi:hypothetical protein
MKTIYRTAKSASDIGEGSCWSADRAAVESYHGEVLITAELTESPVQVPGYDRDLNETPADSRAQRDLWAAEGALVVAYSDEDLRGWEMTTLRLVGTGAIRVLSVEKR